MSSAPFPSHIALNTKQLAHPDMQPCSREAEHILYVPSEPTVDLLTDEVNTFLSSQLQTPVLDDLYDRLWLAAKKSSQNIDALHVQKIKGREIVPAEDSRLHLIWQHDRIYIKPLPVCLLNYDFWTMHLPKSKVPVSTSKYGEDSSFGVSSFDRSIAVGFMRSYALLIKHHLDFVLAKESHLIPDDVDWVKWSKFIVHFRNLGDDQVARRYHYGQLRLSRLQWVVRLFRPPNAKTWWFYDIPHWSITRYLTQATIALFFVFASISLVLSSMQVALSVPADALWIERSDGSGLRDMGRSFWAFAIVVLLFSVVIWVLLISIPLIILIWQLSWGFRRRREEARSLISSDV